MAAPCGLTEGLEAERLISISLGKMAASRVGRTGASLHKSLLVASVLHRARHVFLENYHVHQQRLVPQEPPPAPVPEPAEAAYTPPPPPVEVELAAEAEDKENRAAEPQQEPEPAVMNRSPLTAANTNCSSNTSPARGGGAALKRRRGVTQQETQEAVWSILPPQKRPRCETNQDQEAPGSMEVEHITSLVSIFSFSGQRVDMCGAEAAREDVAQYQPVALAV